jgi:hypothetical protein
MTHRQHTMVRTYTSDSAYRKDAESLARKGWSVSNVTEQRPRTGCLRLILLWWLVLIWPPKPKLVVTYVRH